MFERLAIDMLRECGGCEPCGGSFSDDMLGISGDEKAVAKGHKYLTWVCDLSACDAQAGLDGGDG